MLTNTLSLQEAFLDTLRQCETPVTVFLVNGFQMRGVIAGSDAFTVALESDGRQNLIYKHAISTVSPLQQVDLSDWRDSL